MKTLNVILVALTLISWVPHCCQADDAAIVTQLTELGAQVTQSDGIVTKVFFKDCSRLGNVEFQMIGQLKDLKVLTLYGQCRGLTDETLPRLTGLQNLEELSTDGIQVTDAGLALFTELKNLKSLAFFHPSFGMKGFDGHGFAALKSLPKLERLTIAGTPFDDQGMAAIAQITQLRDFRTWHTYQTKAGNESLTKLPELRSLWLGQRLRRYDGGSNAASLDDSTFDVLSRLKTLESLTLDEARLSATALARLRELPRLKKLELRRIDCPSAEIETIKLALPAVTIDWKPLTEEEQTKLTGFLKE
ncbi:MAG: hypothetical protein JSS49_02515 [Planctomycetes bacterium]|nr:hypothetical protein [Planctomycetota bacterium]